MIIKLFPPEGSPIVFRDCRIDHELLPETTFFGRTEHGVWKHIVTTLPFLIEHVVTEGQHESGKITGRLALESPVKGTGTEGCSWSGSGACLGPHEDNG